MADIATLMAKLGCTAEEAADIIKSDREIERGKNPFPLTPEQEKASKAARITTSINAYGKKVQRVRAEDSTKRDIMDAIVEMLADNAATEGRVTEYELINPEREVSFVMDSRKFKITLSAPRN